MCISVIKTASVVLEPKMTTVEKLKKWSDLERDPIRLKNQSQNTGRNNISLSEI